MIYIRLIIEYIIWKKCNENNLSINRKIIRV